MFRSRTEKKGFFIMKIAICRGKLSLLTDQHGEADTVKHVSGCPVLLSAKLAWYVYQS